MLQSWKARIAASSSVAIAVTVLATSFGPARAAVESFLSCSSSSSCLEWDNSGSGSGVKGTSAKGNAVIGQTNFNSSNKPAGKSGVVGTDGSSGGTLDSGVSGTSTRGVGVSGISTSGVGVSGTSASSNAVQGLATAAGGSGVYGATNASTGIGVAGRNTSSTHSSGSGMLADGGPANNGLNAVAGTADAVYAYSGSGISLNAYQGFNSTSPELNLHVNGTASHSMIRLISNSSINVFDVDNLGELSVNSDGRAAEIGNNSGDYQNDALDVYSGGAGTDFGVFTVSDVNGAELMGVSDLGNLNISGLLTSNGSCQSGCMEGGKRVRSVAAYAPLESEPTIEDSGEANIVDGSGYVRLDAKFANVIDGKSRYIVFVTPEGDCRGLFVTQRTASGFTVRELQNGHDSLSFGYRIVAKQFGRQAQRLPMTAVRTMLRRHRH